MQTSSFSYKYRKKVLTREVEEYLKDVIMEIAKEKGFEVSAMEVVEEDHIHIFVSGHPKISPSYMVKMIMVGDSLFSAIIVFIVYFITY